MNQPQDKAPSGTAKLVCYVRALSHYEHGEADAIAEHFLSPQTRSRVRDRAVRQHIIRQELPSALYSFIVARTRLVDQLYREALTNGTEQIILLGAGYDSRPYRIGADIPVFEVDAPATQALKRRWLNEADIDIPPSVTFVPVDFNYQSLGDLLPLAGYHSDRRTLFIWEGVTYYLESPAVEATLRFVSANSAPATTIAFDYAYQRVLRDRTVDLAAEQALSGAEAEGEPYRFGIEEGEVDHFLHTTGLRLASHWSPEMLQQQFLDERFDPSYSFIAFAVAGNSLPGQ